MLPKKLILVIAATVALLAVAPASAGKTWCRTDPVILVDQHIIDVQVASNVNMLISANGPIQMVVTVPTSSHANVLLQDLGFGRGYDIKIVTSNDLDPEVLAVVALRAPATHGALPVTVYGTRLSLGLSVLNGWTGAAAGTANEWITFEIR